MATNTKVLLIRQVIAFLPRFSPASGRDVAESVMNSSEWHDVEAASHWTASLLIRVQIKVWKIAGFAMALDVLGSFGYELGVFVPSCTMPTAPASPLLRKIVLSRLSDCTSMVSG